MENEIKTVIEIQGLLKENIGKRFTAIQIIDYLHTKGIQITKRDLKEISNVHTLASDNSGYYEPVDFKDAQMAILYRQSMLATLSGTIAALKRKYAYLNEGQGELF